MNVLVACEESQTVTIEFRKLGHKAFSCDTEPCSGGHPEYHLQMDALSAFRTCTWDLIIAHPPCTHLSVSGTWCFPQKRADDRQQAAIDFFMLMINAPAPMVCVENPVCIMSTHYRRPDQIIQPWMFGHGKTKATCLWLKNLPSLTPTDIVSGRENRV